MKARLAWWDLKEIVKFLEAIPPNVAIDGDITLYGEDGESHLVGLHYDNDNSHHYLVVANGEAAEA